MNPGNYKYLADLLESKMGLVLGENKAYLLNARLTPLVEQYEVEHLDALMNKVREGNAKLLAEVIDAMTTNETSFFRDGKPFELLFEKVLPKIIENRKSEKTIRLWNAACSSGQEPYSITMGMQERVPALKTFRTEILATDISNKILEQAKSGVYNHFEVQRGLPITYLVKYFKQDEGTYTLSNEIRSKIRFQALNLLTPFTSLGKFDIIFCRNVLIYFDPEVKKDILERMAAQLKPDGYIFLGGTETILGITDKLQRVRGEKGIAYCLKDAAAEVLQLT